MGLFSKKKNEEVAIDELTPQIKTKLDELAQKGNQFEEEEQYEEAIQAWKEALSLIPEPQQFYSETIWFLAAIGDIYFQKKQYEHFGIISFEEVRVKQIKTVSWILFHWDFHMATLGTSN